MTIFTQEFWTEETFEVFEDKLRRETRMVKFGFLNFFDSELKAFTATWIGEVNRKKRTFKLFRVTGSDTTSDLAVKGQMVQRGARNVLVIRHSLQPGALLGLCGLLVFVYAIWFLVDRKTDLHVLWLILALAIAGSTYCGFILRDLRNDIEAITRLVKKEQYIPDLEKYARDDEED